MGTWVRRSGREVLEIAIVGCEARTQVFFVGLAGSHTSGLSWMRRVSVGASESADLGCFSLLHRCCRPKSQGRAEQHVSPTSGCSSHGEPSPDPRALPDSLQCVASIANLVPVIPSLGTHFSVRADDIVLPSQGPD